jgi:hypothetical protein
MPLDDPSTPADVCVVCALAEEARAFLEMVTQRCQVTFEERLSRRYHYDYRSATITNRKTGAIGASRLLAALLRATGDGSAPHACYRGIPATHGVHDRHLCW